MIKALNDAFPTKTKYFQRNAKDCFAKGYININEISNRKLFFKESDYEQLKALFIIQRDSPEDMTKQMWSKYYSLYNGMKRKTMNYPIQGTAADMTKIAATLIHNYLKEKGYLGNTANIVNLVHDEIDIECHKDIAEELSVECNRLMVEAGNIFCKVVPMKVDPEIANYWKK